MVKTQVNQAVTIISATAKVEFKPNKFLLLDVLSRYGSLCEVQTDSEMGRNIIIRLDKYTKLESDHPLNLLALGLKSNEFITMRFASPDRIYVTELLYTYNKNDKEPEPNKDASENKTK